MFKPTRQKSVSWLFLLNFLSMVLIDSRMASATNYTEFVKLSDIEKIVQIEAAIKDRAEKLKNFHVISTTEFAVVKNKNGEPGEKTHIEHSEGYRSDVRYDNADYCFELARVDTKGKNTHGSFRSAWDAKKQVAKTYTRYEADDHPQHHEWGLIDKEEPEGRRQISIGQWINFVQETNNEERMANWYLLLQKNIRTAKIEYEDKTSLVKIQFKVTNGPIIYQWTFWLDPSKKFSSTRLSYSREFNIKQKQYNSFTDIKVVDSKMFNDIWIPTHIIEFIHSGKDSGNTYETKVALIELGTVKKKDLEIIFKDGMQIQDVIKNEIRTQGKPGSKPLRTEEELKNPPIPVMLTDEEVKAMQKADKQKRNKSAQ